MNAGTAAYGIAAWWSGLATFEGRGRRLSKWPFHLAGLSPERRPCTFAQSSTRSIRERTRLAVSVRSAQIGRRQAMTAIVSMSATGISRAGP